MAKSQMSQSPLHSIIDMEDYDKIKRILSVAFIQFIEREGERLTDEECIEIEKAFDEQDWNKLTHFRP